MFKLQALVGLRRIVIVTSPVRCFSKSNVFNQISNQQSLSNTAKRRINLSGWLLLLIPAATFGLGTWQIQRKKQKEALIARLQSLSNSEPVPLPHSTDEIKTLEYRPVRVRGHFLHDKELYMGPRSLLSETSSSLFSGDGKKNVGFLVITPFKLSDRDETILVNRGWVPKNKKNPSTRSEGQIEGEVDLTGIVRLAEKRQPFTPDNNEKSNNWFYRDLEQMAAITGASPIYLDATSSSDVASGPIGGQTRINIRNEHMSYILTWYGLSLATSFLWYHNFLRR